MNRKYFLIFALYFLCAGPVSAFEEPDSKPYVTAQRQLSINRSLLAKSEAEYKHLSEEQAESPSNEAAENLSRLEYKIKALREDAQRLQSELPKSTRAAEFLKDLTNHAPLDLDREQKLNQKLEAVYALHEKALNLVSQKRYADASRAYEDIIMESADDDEAYLLLGHTRLMAGDYQKAEQAFLSAIQIDPADRDEIPRFYENVLLENPQDDAALSHLGFALWILGEKNEAKEAFEAAVQINPENLEAKTALDRIRAARLPADRQAQ